MDTNGHIGYSLVGRGQTNSLLLDAQGALDTADPLGEDLEESLDLQRS